jgi:hypothetical protein
MSRPTLIALLLAVSTPALAQGPTTPPKVQTAPEPAAGTDFRKIIHDAQTLLYDQCHKDGGGMISGSDGEYHCVDASGRTLW